ncbi:MAG: helix-hairpin-helix domain-containing protein [Bacteroidota bacterium]|nr:helix-hairpin-helix domain-containing protein [Bacteroidota bacterium]
MSSVFNYSYAQETQQEPAEPPIEIEQQLENLTESDEDGVIEDDSYLQSLHHFIRQPINLNYADAGLLQQLNFLSPLQIDNLLSYRKLLGNFLSIYELQAIPAWDIALIRKLRPYITIAEKMDFISSLQNRLKMGNHTILLRSAQVLEKSKGYVIDSGMAKNFYPGSRQKILFRYKYIFRNLLQYGITAEKDAGEQFFKGSQKPGFDFYSAHFFVRNLGIIKSLAIGDFSVNLGQGLIQWQSLAFKKGADILNIKRQSDVLRPYNSSGEIVFNRGLGITLKKSNWETTGFVSYRKLDAGFDRDTLNYEDYVTSLHTSGYHRTASEIAGKNFQGLLSFGGNINYSNEKFHAGVNGVHYNFDHKIIKADYLYNKYAISGKRAGNYSVDYSYTLKNLHFFGEAATDKNLNKAFVNGLLISTDSHVDMSFLYRKIHKSYQSLYGNAFTENTFPTNENGFYSGITINPLDYLRIDAYADFFNFPWLKYRTDAPTSGNEYMVQFTYTPNKQAVFSMRYKTKNKPINYNPDNLTLNPVTTKTKQELRTHFSYQLNKIFIFRSRAEMVWYDKKGNDPQNGFLIYTDLIYKSMKSLSGNIRLMYFETEGYNSRMYAFENDVLYGYSIPVFFDKGYHYYVNINYDVSKKLSLWARLSQTIYPDKKSVGSGLDMTDGHSKTEIKLQGIYSF